MDRDWLPWRKTTIFSHQIDNKYILYSHQIDKKINSNTKKTYSHHIDKKYKFKYKYTNIFTPNLKKYNFLFKYYNTNENVQYTDFMDLVSFLYSPIIDIDFWIC